eukprot:g42654.t1
MKSPAMHSDPVCTSWQAYSLTSFNLSKLLSEVPNCFKKTTTILVPKKTHVTCLNDYCPVALTSTIMKCFASNMKELVIDFRKQGGGHTPVYINGAEAEMVESVKFLGVMITNNLSWSTHFDAMAKKAQRCLYFLRRLRKFIMS